MKNILVAFFFLFFFVVTSLLHGMEQDKHEAVAIPTKESSLNFFSTFIEKDHLHSIEREYGQRTYCLDLTYCGINSLKELKLLKKNCVHTIGSIDLSHNSLKKINLFKFIDLFPYLRELKVNNSGVNKVHIVVLPEKFNLEMMHNDLKDIAPFIAQEESSCNFEGNFELGLTSKRNIEQAFTRPWLDRISILEQSLNISRDIKYIHTLFALGVLAIYLTRGTEGYTSKVIFGRGVLAFGFLFVLSYLLVKKYYCDYHDVTYKGNFRF